MNPTNKPRALKRSAQRVLQGTLVNTIACGFLTAGLVLYGPVYAQEPEATDEAKQRNVRDVEAESFQLKESYQRTDDSKQVEEINLKASSAQQISDAVKQQNATQARSTATRQQVREQQPTSELGSAQQNTAKERDIATGEAQVKDSSAQEKEIVAQATENKAQAAESAADATVQQQATATQPSKRPLAPPRIPPSPITANLTTSAVPPLPVKAVIPSVTNANQNSNFEPSELMLVSADMAAAKQAASYLNRYGAQIKTRSVLTNLGLVMSVFRLPEGEDTLAIIRQIQTDLPNLQTDTNQRYQLQNSRKTYGASMVGWPQAPSCIAQNALHVGVIDTPVNTAHPALLGANIQAKSFIKGEPASATHGTAVASILVGSAQAGFSGLLPQAQLTAAAVFRQRGERVEATTDSLLLALDWLVQQQVSVINLSLGGERNRVLAQAIEQVLAKRIAVVAAAGNNGPQAEPVYPAAQAGVIAVTAVDAAGRLYDQANQGSYIEFAAPGVDIWAADNAQGGHYHTGTSFAAPYLTAALAVANIQQLQAQAQDKGPAGKDPQYGHGLLTMPPLCQ
ncbi:S8 family serine peptidase [Saccharophagus degradans]|uniref:S8 family serine peptidase n=1 Tax=Saccharophagus degradans TaxID=86304 RepID=UPI001C0898E1|nr:S8 family serine peptidase [Saccharophagus degradans]MBU2987380.1 S8 family serine peptidase [Saccharophagus degradans]